MNISAKESPIPVVSNRSIKSVLHFQDAKDKIAQKQLRSFRKHQQKFLNKLCRLKPNQADALYRRWGISDNHLMTDLNSAKPKFYKGGRVYDSFKDSLQSLSGFIQSHPDSLQANDSLISEIHIGKSFSQEEVIRNYMRQQKCEMKQVFAENPELAKCYKQIDKDAYYFLQENKYMDGFLHDNKYFKDEWVNGLGKSLNFNSYYKEASEISNLYEKPNEWGHSLDGLQTNSNVKKLENELVAKLDDKAKELIPENIGEGKRRLNKLKTELPWLNNSSDVPDFKPNLIKGKPIKDRIKTNFDFQFSQGKNYYPSGLELGASIKYEIRLNGYMGLFSSYKLPFERILEEKKVSFGAFYDYPIKDQLFFNVGYEICNTNQDRSTTKLKLNERKSWYGFHGYESLLIGFKWMQPIFKFGYTTLSLQIDPLYNSHSPASSFVVYRVGYGF